MILGITGRYCSGKDTVAEFLKEKGFVHISLSDFIREEAKKREMPDTRENLIVLGNELRKIHGSNILALRALQKSDFKKNTVITSIRNPAEVELLKKQPHFTLVQVIAPPQLRWQRMQARQRNDNLKTFEEFQKWEAQESNSLDPAAQQLHTVMKMADQTLSNEGTLARLQHDIDKLLKELSP